MSDRRQEVWKVIEVMKKGTRDKGGADSNFLFAPGRGQSRGKARIFQGCVGCALLASSTRLSPSHTLKYPTALEPAGKQIQGVVDSILSVSKRAG